MKKAAVILAILVFSFLYYLGVLTQKESLPFSKEFYAGESAPTTGQAFEIREFLKGRTSGQPTLSAKDLDQLYELKLDREIRNIPAVSFFLIREAQEARKAGDKDRSIQLAASAVRFSPDLPEPYFEVARARWSQSPFQLGRIFSPLFQGAIALVTYYPTSLNLFYNVFYVIANSLLVTFMILGIIVLVKYVPLYFYDIHKNLTQEISKLLWNSLKILVLLIPFFLRLDILWSILFWTVLLWGYVSKKEKQWILVFLILLVYLPFFLRSSSSFLNSDSSGILLEMNKANYENWDGSTEQKLQDWLKTHPGDPDVLFTLALMEKKQGRYDQAEKLYQSAIQYDPAFSDAYSNLGYVYAARKEFNLASDSYEKAAKTHPKAAYYYNLYRLYSQQSFLSTKADEFHRRATRLDPKLIETHRDVNPSKQSNNLSRLLIEEPLSSKRLWGRVWNYFGRSEGLLFPLFKAWFEEVPSRVNFLLPVFFLLFWVGMSRYSRAKRFMTACPMCGSPTYRFYLGAAAQDFICFNCHRMFVQKEKLHPRIVEKKSAQVEHFQKQNDFIGKALSIFMIGFGYLWRGMFLKGLCLSFLFFILILRFVYWNGVINLSWMRVPPTFWKWIFWVGLFVVIYFIFLRKTFRLRPKFETRWKTK